MKRWFLLLAWIKLVPVCAQVHESFSDPDLADGPVWSGTPASWSVTSGQLQSTNTLVNGSFYLSTIDTLSINVQWECNVHLAFNTSSTNYADIFLTASDADPTRPATTGYFVRIGNTQDEVSLYRKDSNGTVRIIDGMDGVTNRSDNILRIKVVRDASLRFSLYRDTTGTGLHYVNEGSVIDGTYTGSAFFALLVKQSTSSFFGRHYFDDIGIGPYVPDVTAPQLLHVIAASATKLDLAFSETLDRATAEDLGHYLIANTNIHPAAAHLDGADPTLVHLDLDAALTNGFTYTIRVSGIADPAGNICTDSAAFSFYQPAAYDVVINELMPDPSPPVGLPAVEYIELKNRSGHLLNLTGWKIMTPSGEAVLPAYSLPADSFLIVCANSVQLQLSAYGRTLGLSNFPSLDNNGALISLWSADSHVIHAVSYSNAWYGDELKAGGGWSLEMIDPENPCSGAANWKASTDPSGGTPGRRNAVQHNNSDTIPPQLLRAYTEDSLTVIACFDGPLDSISAARASSYHVGDLSIVAAHPLPPLFDRVALTLSAPLQVTRIYTVTASHVADCSGNRIGVYDHCDVGLMREALPGQIVVNEILFDPPPGCSDFIELYNRGDRAIDAAGLYLGNRNASGIAGSWQKIGKEHFALLPGNYLVLTTDPAALTRNYFAEHPGQIIGLPSLPSYPDDAGTVLLADAQGGIVDEVPYSAQWHFPLISNRQGISLERVDPGAPSAAAASWHSAAATVGYATPTYRNSQYHDDQASAAFAISPHVFSPNSDGRDDYTTITCRTEAPGYVANMMIYDAAGRKVRYLVKEQLLGTEGRWQWDGLDDQHRLLPAGVYIVSLQLFDISGKTRHSEQTVVLQR